MRSVRELARFATRFNAAASLGRSLAPPAALAAQSRVFTMSTPAAVEVDAYKVGDSTNIKWHEGSVDTATREKAMNQKGCVLWFTGLSGSGKSTVAYTLEHALFQRGKVAQVLDGDNIRHGGGSPPEANTTCVDLMIDGIRFSDAPFPDPRWRRMTTRCRGRLPGAASFRVPCARVVR